MLLEISHLSGGFQGEDEYFPVLHDLSISIDKGKTTGLVGESGSGKSVTVLAVMQLLNDSGFSCTGKVLFEGNNLLNFSEKKMRRIRGRRIGMIFQEPMTSLNPVYPIGSQIIEPLVVHKGLSRQEAEKKAVELLERTRIAEPRSRLSSYPHQLSGGQRQRIMIAMALACGPSLLIADEPTTALDVTIQAQILELLKELQQGFNMAIILISHDLHMVRKVAEQVYIMKDGGIAEEGETEKIFASPQHPYTVKLLENIPGGEAVYRKSTEYLFRIDNLRCSFPVRRGFFKRKIGEIKALDNISLNIRKGTTYGVVGESGSGKSTLGRCILRLTGARGNIEYQGMDLLSCNSRRMRLLRRDLQIIFQDPYSSLSPRMTVNQIIGEGLQVHGIGRNKKERQKIVEETLLEVGMDPANACRYPHEFSGGQRQRIAIARTLALNPKFLVLDEPTSALDMTIQTMIIKLLKKIQQKYGITYLFISHDLRVVRALAHEVAVMKDGRIIESGRNHDLFTSPVSEYTRQLMAAVF
ncbi:MAG: ABC transporter ATP-binding protein [Thermodesulfobacteriota bacterium]